MGVQDYLDQQLDDPLDKEIGIGGFTALVRISEQYKLTAEVPSTPVEDGSFVNDHIILKPLVLSISGDVSDVHLRASLATSALTSVQAEIGNVVSQYAPARTQAQLAQVNALVNDVTDAIQRVDNLLDTGSQVLDLFGNQDTETKGIQEQFLDAMESLHKGRQAITIDMPFRSHKNMVITSLAITYDNEIDSTGFSLEATQIILAELQFAETGTPSAGLGGQTDALVDGGTQEGAPVETSFASSLVSSIFGS